ncbi:MAG: serine hydroxymethyltransferase [Planctomycetes bacterium]|nr:serine hydroxymethyltransferase [Planctomycetota bacterium]
MEPAALREEGVREVEEIVRRQDAWRLTRTINLIASENALSRRARALLGSDFNHRYAEGHPGARYYQGTEHIDAIEAKCREAIKEIFECRQAEIRTISGTNANDVVWCALAGHGAKVVANALPAGGHISHQPLGGLGKFTTDILHWPRLEDGFRVDVAKAKDLIVRERPKVVLFGRSLILFREPVAELAPVAREIGASVIYDGAHVLGLIGGKAFQDPLAEGAHVLMGSTHKTFPGPQRGVLLSNLDDEQWKKIDRVAFPGSLSNHHLMTLPPLLVTAYEFLAFGRDYARQVVANAKHLGRSLHQAGFAVAAADLGYTETHQVAVDVSAFGGGAPSSERLKNNDIICNRNQLPKDPPKKVGNPSGLRLGTQEMTRFGMKERDMADIARFVRRVLKEAKYVGDDVVAFRRRYQSVHYSFDNEAASPDEAPEPETE